MFLKKNKKVAIIYKDLRISYTNLLEKVTEYSRLFPKNSDKVLIFSENRPEWIFSFYAGWMNGSTVVPVDYVSTTEELAYIINDCRPQVLFCSKERHAVLSDALKLADYKPQVLVYEDIPASAENEICEMPQPDIHDTAVIIYTSGTTGSPKGVMLSYENLLANVDAVSIGVPIYTSERNVMILLPLHHIFPLLGSMVAPLKVGGTVAISPTMQSADIISTLQDNQISIIIGVPRLYKMIRKGIIDKINANKVAKMLFKLAEKVNSQKLSKTLFKSVHEKFGGHLKFLVAGGAALDPEVGRDFQTLGFEVLEGFGMTEAAPMITFTRPGEVTIGSAGTAMSCTKIEIRDGEIVASGKNIMKGYYNRPEETAEVLKDGWLYTGDLGHLDEKGQIFITGRKKEIIVLSNGKNINPVEIEQKLENMSDCINEIGVFQKDDVLQAVIYPDLIKIKKMGISEMESHFRNEVIDKYNQSVSPYKKIMKLTLVDNELPRTRLSKLKRFLLPDLVGETTGKKVSTEHPEFEEYHIIKEFLESQTEKDISPDDHLEMDIALDSLDKVSLVVFLKSTFGIDISEQNLMTFQTVRKLSEYTKEKKKKLSVELTNWASILKEKVDLKLPTTWFTTTWIKNGSRIFFKLYFRFKGEGLQNIPEPPFILAPNHQSFFDGLFVASLLKDKHIKKTYFYAKEKHVRMKVLRFLANRNNVIVMDINSNVKESIQKLAEVLKKGKNVMIFPEGTRTLDGTLGKFKKTFAIISKELNVPVVPVTINGAYEVLPRGSHFPRPFKKITVNFLEPVFPENHTYDSLKDQVYAKVKKYIHK